MGCECKGALICGDVVIAEAASKDSPRYLKQVNEDYGQQEEDCSVVAGIGNDSGNRY